jgi:hypothetical protein
MLHGVQVVVAATIVSLLPDEIAPLYPALQEQVVLVTTVVHVQSLPTVHPKASGHAIDIKRKCR